MGCLSENFEHRSRQGPNARSVLCEMHMRLAATGTDTCDHEPSGCICEQCHPSQINFLDSRDQLDTHQISTDCCTSQIFLARVVRGPAGGRSEMFLTSHLLDQQHDMI